MDTHLASASGMNEGRGSTYPVDHKSAQAMSEEEFQRLSEFIHTRFGIKMPLTKRLMLEVRLRKRLRCLGLATFRDYCQYLFNSPKGLSEQDHMINAVTTNKTEFFREPGHFALLVETILPGAMETRGTGMRPFTLWSAGCSSGEEPYSLAMVLSEFGTLYPEFKFTVLATDISTTVLEKAKLGIYDEERVAPVPALFRRKYLLWSKDRRKKTVRIIPELRSLVLFQRMNLMDEQAVLPQQLDAIFCRNVIIYFERADQERLLLRLSRFLAPGGHLFLGNSETVHGYELPLVRVTSTVYRKDA